MPFRFDDDDATGRREVRDEGREVRFQKNSERAVAVQKFKIQNSKFEIAGTGLPACGVRKKAPAFHTLYTNIQVGVQFVHVTHAWRSWPMRMAMGLVRMA